MQEARDLAVKQRADQVTGSVLFPSSLVEVTRSDSRGARLQQLSSLLASATASSDRHARLWAQHDALSTELRFVRTRRLLQRRLSSQILVRVAGNYV